MQINYIKEALAHINYAQVQGRRKAGSARSPEPGPVFWEAPRSTKLPN